MICKTCGKECPSCGTRPILEARSSELDELMKNASGSPSANLNKVYQQGYSEGYAKGVGKGKNEAVAHIDVAHKQGYSEGYNEGFAEANRISYDKERKKDPALLHISKRLMSVLSVIIIFLIIVGMVAGWLYGINAGRQSGYATGFDAGKNAGFSEGFSAGQQVGNDIQQASYLAGYEAGLQEAAATPTPPADIPTPVPSSKTDVESTPLLNDNVPLSFASKGEEVLSLQKRLQDLGYYTGSLDGKYGPQTKEAVEKFQRDNDLQVDGTVGPETLAKLFPIKSDEPIQDSVLPIE